MPGLYILIFIACIVVGLVISGRFGDKLYDKTEDVKDIYIKEEGEVNDEQER